MLIPQFETERLILRAVTQSDVPSYKKHFVDYEIIRHLSSRVPWPYPENGVEDFINNFILPFQGKDKWVWGIFLKTNPDELIGVIDLWRKGIPEHRGFWLGRAFWNQGIMTEAVSPIIDYAFTSLGFEKLIFSNARGNIKSRRIKEKTGAQLIGIKPSQLVDPQYTESEIWELTKQSWEESKK
jgi:ribosomal-protein-alanine N-acetyltransferase